MADEEEPKQKGYQVGYGKPPAHSRWKTNGASPNPKGRPKGSRNHRTELINQLNKTIVVTENGKRVRKTKFEVIIAQQVNKATAGELKATQFVISEMVKYGLVKESNETESLSPTQTAVFEEVIRRLRANDVHNDATGKSDDVPSTQDRETSGAES